MQKKTISLPSYIKHILQPHTKWFLIGMLARIIWALEASFSPYVLKQVIDLLKASPGTLIVAWWWAKVYVCTWLIRSLSFRLSDYAHLQLYPNLRRDITMQMFSHLTGHSHDYFQQNRTGSLQNRIHEITDSATSIIYKLAEAAAQLLMIALALFTMAKVHLTFALILGAWLIIFCTIPWLFSHKIGHQAFQFAKARTRYAGHIVDTISNIFTMRVFAQRKYEIRRSRKVLEDSVHKNRAMQQTILTMKAIWDVTIIIMMTTMLFTLMSMYSKKQATIGDFALIMSLATRVFHSVWWFVSQITRLSEEIGKCKQGLLILNTPYQITDAKEAQPLQVTEGKIQFHNVHFKYDKEAIIFSHMNVTIAPKEKVGIVGFSGEGKTSFAHLILRLFDVSAGKITIDGQDIRKVTQKSLRNNITIIPQDTVLFHRTIMENIRYGKPGATDQEVIEAAKKARCHQFISKLPKKYHTLVGERGIKISGGQRQRIAIARAMIRKSPILILDEATGSLDVATEQYIQQSLNMLMKDHTTIVIAHRLSTLVKMDRILVFDKGKLVEEGTHTALLQRQGHYARLWSMKNTYSQA